MKGMNDFSRLNHKRKEMSFIEAMNDFSRLNHKQNVVHQGYERLFQIKSQKKCRSPSKVASGKLKAIRSSGNRSFLSN